MTPILEGVPYQGPKVGEGETRQQAMHERKSTGFGTSDDNEDDRGISTMRL